METTIKMTAAIESGLTAIKKALENNETLLQLFATDIQQNTKLEQYYRAATAGECVPIAYDEADTAKAFFEVLARTATSGQDVPFQPQLRMSDTCKALLFTHSKTTPRDGANAIVRLIPDDISFDELLSLIGTAIQETGAKLVIIDDLTKDAKWCGNAILFDLNELADTFGVVLLAGFMLTVEDEETSRFLATRAHNLWQLKRHSLNMVNDDGESNREQPYFCFSYGGSITPKRVFYGIDSNGNACMVRDLAKLLRIKEFAQMFAQKWISQSKFVDMCFGATDGEFEKNSFVKAIQVAADNGIIQKSGSGNKTKLCYAHGKMSRATNSGNIALTAFGNPYTNPTHTKKRMNILRHGEFKLLVPENGTSPATMQNFVISMMKAVITGIKWLEVDIKTVYRNTLAIILGASEKAVDKLSNDIKALGDDVAGFIIIGQPEGATDREFLTAYKQAVDTHKPDFVFIFCYDRITPSIYTEAQLAKELAIYSKKKGICTIAESDKEKDRKAFGFAGNEYWSISPLVCEADRDEIAKEYGITIPPIYSFQGSVGNFDFLCRFGNSGKGGFMNVDAKEQDRAFLIGTFAWCKNMDCRDLECDCTGKALTKSVIYRAQKSGLIDVEQYGKTLLDSKVTFKGE